MEQAFFKPNPVRNIQDLQKKRKRSSSSSNASSSEDQEVEESKTVTEIQCKRQIHSKIEKRRRDKMNSYIAQLTSMIPTYNMSAQKLDKITVLRMTVQYLRSIQNSPMQLTSEESIRYSFISDEEMKRLILQVSEGFVFVLACDSAKIMYISESVTKILKCNRASLLERSLYDVIHPHDIYKIKEQISCAEINPRHQLGTSTPKELDLKVPSEQLGLYPGNRRSFFFRIKSNLENTVIKETLNGDQYTYPNYKARNEIAASSSNPVEQNQYDIIQCTGYLKCWNPIVEKEKTSDNSEDVPSVTCLIGVGRKLDNFSETYQMENPTTFVSKHAVDGKFLFVDHWITIITGYLPQELLATNIYDYIHSEDVNEFAAAHQSLLQFAENSSVTQNFRFRTKFGNYVDMQSEWKSLINPWKRDVEYFYSKNTVHWSKDIKLNFGEQKEKTTNELGQNELFAFTNYPSEVKPDHNLIMDFNFHNAISEKTNDEASMEAILKLLECDANMAD